MFSLEDASEKYFVQNYINVLSSTCEELIISALEEEDPSQGFSKAIENVIYKQVLINFFNKKVIEEVELTQEDLINAMFNEEGVYRFLIITAKNGARKMIDKYKHLFESQIENRHYEWQEIQSIVVEAFKDYLASLN